MPIPNIMRYALKKLDLLFFSVLLNAHTNIMTMFTQGTSISSMEISHSLIFTGSSKSSCDDWYGF